MTTDTPTDEQLAGRATAAGLRLRPGDQPLPMPTDAAGAHDLLIAMLAERKQIGLDRYGSLLQPHNGRDTARDLEEELLDAVVYTRTMRREIADLEALLVRAVREAPGTDAWRRTMVAARELLVRRGVSL